MANLQRKQGDVLLGGAAAHERLDAMAHTRQRIIFEARPSSATLDDAVEGLEAKAPIASHRAVEAKVPTSASAMCPLRRVFSLLCNI